MIAFDTDVLTGILRGRADDVERVSLIPVLMQAVPVIVVEEIVRGRLNVVRQAEAGRSKISVDRAYDLFQQTFSDFLRIRILPYTAEAESQFKVWRSQGVRVATHDLRIAAICRTYDATLISRNRRDFERIPGLSVEFWT